MTHSVYVTQFTQLSPGVCLSALTNSASESILLCLPEHRAEAFSRVNEKEWHRCLVRCVDFCGKTPSHQLAKWPLQLPSCPV